MTIQNFVDSMPTAKSLFDYSSKADAISAFHSTMASSVANTNVSSVLCMLFNEIGDTLKYDRYTKE